jgi:predicted  nucleic acid-binding Zn-ribbon protein
MSMTGGHAAGLGFDRADENEAQRIVSERFQSWWNAEVRKGTPGLEYRTRREAAFRAGFVAALDEGDRRVTEANAVAFQAQEMAKEILAGANAHARAEVEAMRERAAECMENVRGDLYGADAIRAIPIEIGQAELTRLREELAEARAEAKAMRKRILLLEDIIEGITSQAMRASPIEGDGR